MILIPRVKDLFPSVICARGDAYATGRRVQLTGIRNGRVAARVRGSGGTVYDVALRVVEGGGNPALGVVCSCPHFEQGAWCKHLWATLRTLDLRGWSEPALERSGKGPLALVDLTEDERDDRAGGGDAGAFEAYEGADDDAYRDECDTEVLPPRTPFPASSAPAAKPALARVGAGRGRPRGWHDRIEGLASRFPGSFATSAPQDGMAALAGGFAPLLYLVDPEEVRRTQKLRLQFGRRPLRRNGSLGALTVARIAVDELERAASSAEAAALAQLLTLAQVDAALAASGYGYSSYARDPSALRAASVVIPSALLDPVLPRLAATGRLALLPAGHVWGNTAGVEPQPLCFDDSDPWQLRLEVAPAARGGYELRGGFVREGAVLAIEAATLVLAGGFLIEAARLARADVAGDVRAVSELRRGPLSIPARELDDAIEMLARTPRLAPLDLATGVPWSDAAAAPAPRLRFTGLDGEARAIEARLDFGYGGAWIEADAPAMRVADRASHTLIARDAVAEARAIETLRSLHFGPAQRGPHAGAARLSVARDAFEAAAHELLAKGWILEVDGARLRSPGRSWARVRSGIDFFALEGGVDFEGEAAPFPALLAAVEKGARFVRLADGSRGLLPRTWVERCARLAALGGADGEALRFDRAQVGVVDALLEAQDEARADRRFSALRNKLADFAGIAPSDAPPGFVGTLRDYQREGLGWLEFLARFQLGGCLADDMGLGKTVQVLALLAGRARGRARARRVSIVVAPKSVIHGWVDEARRFAPALRVLRYEGTERAALREQIAEHDVVVTTYGTLLRDVAQLAEQRFDYAILDEAQAIKNAGSRTARAAKALRAEHRLALTGTPVENHLGELASLLEFLNPGSLGRARGFAALAGGRQDAASVALLARTLRPVLLRRTKAQVLPELPAKTEQTILCDLDGRQRRDYDELRRHFQASLAHRIEQAGLARSKIHVLEALLRLRQAACHPALIDASRAGESAAKLDVLFAQLDEVLDEGHKALVFSQFTRLLAQVRAGLDGKGIPYAYLDGRTRDRKQRVAQFQEDPACRLFLVSLKAGGTGLNLTAADYVFLLDPWWNPAVEAQAVDRAHRIGQSRPVFAYRLVARDTVEERILELQERKRSLAASIFESDESLVASLSAEDLRLLLA